jgi:hypothetical protein
MAADKECMYNQKEACKALEVDKFLKALGYHMLNEPVAIVDDVNIMNTPHTRDDVRSFYDIYSDLVPRVRGRAPKRKAKHGSMVGQLSKIQRTHQEMTADVTHVGGEKFLVSISSPLKLSIILHLKGMSEEELGKALQGEYHSYKAEL